MQSSLTVSATKKVPTEWKILRSGGVFLSDKPRDGNEGAGGDKLVKVTLPDDCCDFSCYELVEEGKPYREWCIPAEIIKRQGTVRLLRTE
jgi:hypothetical protein